MKLPNYDLHAVYMPGTNAYMLEQRKERMKRRKERKSVERKEGGRLKSKTSLGEDMNGSQASRQAGRKKGKNIISGSH